MDIRNIVYIRGIKQYAMNDNMGNILLFIMTGVVFISALVWVQYRESHDHVGNE